MKRILFSLGLSLTVLPVFAAVQMDLDKQPATLLATTSTFDNQVSFVEKNRSVDFNQTLHIRLQQTYLNYPVYGADIVIHTPKIGDSSKHFQSLVSHQSSMNGHVYSDLARDLKQQPETVFNSEQAQRILKSAEQRHRATFIVSDALTLESMMPLIYVDNKKVAHWAYRVNFNIISTPKGKIKPVVIIDAENHTIYKQWNNLQTSTVLAGGFGGNHKTGQKMIDGVHFPAMTVDRDHRLKICYMRNINMNIIDDRNSNTMQFSCNSKDPEHNNVYWNGNHDQVETTWSPSNDVMFGVKVTQDMFNDWYKIPVLKQQNGKAMLLRAVVHYDDTNAYWDEDHVIFGNSNGSNFFNPFTQLDTVGHEICHGFTQQNSGLIYNEQSGGLNEAFSDMAGIAAEYYAYGKTDFLVGLGDVKAKDKALRYMDLPSKDCDGDIGAPGEDCSIDHIDQYEDWMGVHYTSGIFNRAYYTLANQDGWNAKKAFDVMVKANQHYWTSTTTFVKAACGVKKAAEDYQYDVAAVATAFDMVGIDVRQC